MILRFLYRSSVRALIARCEHICCVVIHTSSSIVVIPPHLCLLTLTFAYIGARRSLTSQRRLRKYYRCDVSQNILDISHYKCSSNPYSICVQCRLLVSIRPGLSNIIRSSVCHKFKTGKMSLFPLSLCWRGLHRKTTLNPSITVWYFTGWFAAYLT